MKNFLRGESLIPMNCYQNGYIGICGCGYGEYIGIYESVCKGYLYSFFTYKRPHPTPPAYMDINARYRSVPIPYHVYIPYEPTRRVGSVCTCKIGDAGVPKKKM